jgi:O-antigen/teichoic acid export membrane protein
LISYWQAILFGRQEIISANQITFLCRLVDTGLLLLLLFILWKFNYTIELQFIIWLLLISALVSNFLHFRKLNILAKNELFGTRGFYEILAYALPCYFGNLVQFLNYRLDIFFVNYFAGQQTLGLYTLAVGLAQLVWLPSNAIASVLLPKIAGKQELISHNANLADQATRLTLCIRIVAGISLSVAGIVLIPLLFGLEFQQSIVLLFAIMPGIIAISPALVLASYIAGIGKPRINLFISVIALLFTLVLDLVLIPRFGAIGASFASTVSYSVTTALTIKFFLRESKIHIGNLFWITGEDVRLAHSFLQGIYQRVSPQKLS